MSQVTYRLATIDDADDVLALWATSGASPSPSDSVEWIQQALAHPNMKMFVADIEGRVIGTIVGGFDGWRGNVYRLAVQQDYRRRGIGRRLLAEVEAMFGGWGARYINALVEKDHPWAVAFWTGAGYPVYDSDRMSLFSRKLP